jgi:hypothetical protein
MQASTHRLQSLIFSMFVIVLCSSQVNRLIDAEVGEDRGQMLPGCVEAGWEVSTATMEL